MKKIPILLLLLTNSLVLLGQKANSFDLNFNHNALLVSDIERSGKFYKEVLGLVQIINRTAQPGRLWLSMGNGTELHLIIGNTEQLYINKSIHFALTAADFDGFIDNIIKRKIPYSSWQGEDNKVTIRADGIRQIYVQDPDGYWIEVNSAE